MRHLALVRESTDSRARGDSLDEGGDGSPPGTPRGPRPRWGLVAGPIVSLALLALGTPDGMDPRAARVAAVGILMAIWWVTEAVPIPVTSLIPLAAFPLLGVQSMEEVSAPYTDPVIFLFMGGFMLALAMQRWELHRRIALRIVAATGVEPRNLIGGFMAATAFISMWVSNTATAVMMLPIGLSVVQLLHGEFRTGESHFQPALLLGIAYAASIGGFATLVGTPPNALLAGFIRQTYGIEIHFLDWFIVGIPMILIVLPLCWLLLTRVLHPIRLREVPGGHAVIVAELAKMGRLSRPEACVAIVFVLTAIAWILRPILAGLVPGGGLTDAGIAITASLVLFLIPAGGGERVMNWDWGKRVPWEVLILFGGGLSLAAAIADTGLAEWIGLHIEGLGTLPTPVLLVVVTAVTILMSELASNTATAAAFLPVVGTLAVGAAQDPLLLAIPAALAASCGFILPVATPPNAIAYGSGYVTVPQMARAGFWLDLICIGAILLVAYTLVPLL
jgi:solute carrier family 13 (sodium-dependent dicarboxylate transporter), member 2/3/5